MTTKLDFSGPVLARDKHPIKGMSNLGSVLANFLEAAVVRGGDSRKFWGWCETLSNGAVLDLDEADMKRLRTFLEEEAMPSQVDPRGMPTFVRAQLLRIVDNAK